MGSSKKQTVSYWYRPFFQLVLHEGPFDKLLQIRGGDVPAWQGELTASGSITINAANIWGGEEKEGGIEGTVDVSFGEMDAQPNPFFQTAMGPDPSGHNGYALLQFNSGRYGAGNPYPKPISVLTERIYEGWLDGECWYRETAAVPLSEQSAGVNVVWVLRGASTYVSGVADGGSFTAVGGAAPSGSFVETWNERIVYIWSSGAAISDDGGITRTAIAVPWSGELYYPPQKTSSGRIYVAVGDTNLYYTDDGGATWSTQPLGFTAMMVAGDDNALIVVRSAGPGDSRYRRSVSGFEFSGDIAVSWEISVLAYGNGMFMFARNVRDSYYWSENVGLTLSPVAVPTTGGGLEAYSLFRTSGGAWLAMHRVNLNTTDRLIARSPDGKQPWVWLTTPAANNDGGTRDGFAEFGGVVIAQAKNNVGELQLLRSVDGGATWQAFDHGMSPVTVSVGSIAAFQLHRPGEYAMNPAHVVYDSLTYLQGEPVATIDDASFRAAAGRLYTEGFGICTRYNHDQESVEQFRQRILDLIGAECSRYNGRWYMDLIRALSPDEIAALPVLTDDDILDWEEDPTTLDDVVNQVSAKWFDPNTKQQRITPAVHALAAINAMGTINAEVKQYPEIPDEGLATRMVARDLRNKNTPSRRMRITTNRKPYSWRKGRPFRLQAPRRGIADMVCLVGEIDRGTLQSGAIKLVAVEHVYAMADTAYIAGQAPVPPPSQVPVPIEHQVAFEAPYVELAGRMSAADLATMDVAAGFVLAAGVKPTTGQGYILLTSAAGSPFERRGVFDWCPSASVAEGAGLDETEFTLVAGTHLARVEVGSAALWGSEVVRVDALDIASGTASFGRGCADTVAARHPPGERVYFYDSWAASDDVERASGEQVDLALLTRTGTQVLGEGDAAEISVTLAQRQARPYPPAGLTVNGESDPESLWGALSLSWRHRDRLLQADQLVDQTIGSVGPEPGTTYTVRIYVDDVLDDTIDAIAGDSVLATPSADGLVRIEVESVRDGLASWQAQVRTFLWSLTEDTADRLTTESGDAITTENSDFLTLE